MCNLAHHAFDLKKTGWDGLWLIRIGTIVDLEMAK